MSEKTEDTTLFLKLAVVFSVIVLVAVIAFAVRSVVEAMHLGDKEKASVSKEPRITGTANGTMKGGQSINNTGTVAVNRSKRDPADFYTDYEYRLGLDDHLKKQNQTLNEEAESLTETGGERSLALSKEELVALEKSGDLVQ